MTGTNPARSLFQNRRHGDEMNNRRIVSRSWNMKLAQRYIKATGKDGVTRVFLNGVTPFRGVMNNQDPLHRQHYQCDSRTGKGCDGTGVPTVSGNTKQTWCHADYIRYKKGLSFLKEKNYDAYGTMDHPDPVSR